MTARELALEVTCHAVNVALGTARIAGEMTRAPEAPPDGRSDVERLASFRRTALASLDAAVKRFRATVTDDSEEGKQTLLF